MLAKSLEITPCKWTEMRVFNAGGNGFNVKIYQTLMPYIYSMLNFYLKLSL